VKIKQAQKKKNAVLYCYALSQLPHSEVSKSNEQQHKTNVRIMLET